MQREWDELLFFAKFLTNAHAVLNRIGADSGDSTNLAIEFQRTVAKSLTLLTTLLGESSEEVKAHFSKQFRVLTHESLANTLSFLKELSWIKNYFLDRNYAP